ncbi:MAG TPA: septal ring lytic transglycosylase RlpA family protein [Acetobacteraceae bacterium]|nr:septal ring lytic transglycosylase RlpA family protein [Acetobacteraceae bacterium]
MDKLGSAALTAILATLWVSDPSSAHARRRTHPAAHQHGHQSAPGTTQKGTASVYAGSLRGRKAADGSRFDPRSNTAASKTLPLGTTAQVTNLENGNTATVQVRDRGPHRPGRIIDVSPGTAVVLGMSRNGTAPVSVTPIAPASGNPRH